ncbi:carboxymuconolactone decarboxylase family protein [Lactobacillus helveticus]|nr:carboxymuconolactone decarboxylase family protein [Lactobacillus helveticus]
MQGVDEYKVMLPVALDNGVSPVEAKEVLYQAVDNCFGDYYTRKGLDDRDREMVTFCYIAAQGGCEPQLLAHAQTNIKLGNDKEFLMKIIEQNVPFIGYPRSLNAVTVVNQADEAVNGKD